MDSLLNAQQQSQTLDIIKIAIGQIQDWLLVTDVNGIILYHNQQVEKISGYKKSEIVGKNPSIWKSGEAPRETYTHLWNTILSDRPYYGVIANRRKNGELFYLANTISPVKNQEGEIQYFVSTAKDITQNYELKRQLHSVLHYDTVTGLLNRNYFVEKVEKGIRESKKSAVLAISIDKIELINNTYGFEYGDQAIKEMGQRIEKAVDQDCIVGRIEANIFGVFIPNIKRFSEILSSIKAIEKQINLLYKIQTHQLDEFYMENATGVGIYPNDAVTGKELVTRAQTALAKAQSINPLHPYAFYTPEMNREVEHQLLLEMDIRKAYENDEFIPYFQPFINIESEAICGLEALMRRQNSAGDIIMPGEFIGLLEDMGLIEQVEMRLIQKVCQQIRMWLDEGLEVVPVAINLSPLQFTNQNLAQEIIEIIDQASIPRDLITIEITESLFMENMVMAKKILQQLKKEGFLISLDDFGTGYSALSYLKEFNADQLKIDMAFVKGVIENKGDQAIIKAIIAMARALDMQTVAEGIEQMEQFQLIGKLGCDIGQGHYWDYALPPNDIARKYLS